MEYSTQRSAQRSLPPWYSAAGESSAASFSCGRDQSLTSGVFTIPACALNSRPDQPAPHQRTPCALSPPHPQHRPPDTPPTTTTITTSLYPIISLCNFYSIFSIPPLHLISSRRRGLNKDHAVRRVGGRGGTSDVLSSFFASIDVSEEEAAKKRRGSHTVKV